MMVKEEKKCGIQVAGHSKDQVRNGCGSVGEHDM